MQSNRESVLIGNKIGEGKARSIVAMLFWEWRKVKFMSSYICFKKAYIMLKDSK